MTGQVCLLRTVAVHVHMLRCVSCLLVLAFVFGCFIFNTSCFVSEIVVPSRLDFSFYTGLHGISFSHHFSCFGNNSGLENVTSVFHIFPFLIFFHSSKNITLGETKKIRDSRATIVGNWCGRANFFFFSLKI